MPGDLHWVLALMKNQVPMKVMDGFLSAFTETGDNLCLSPRAATSPRPSGGTGSDPGGFQRSIGNRSSGRCPQETFLKKQPGRAEKFPCWRRLMGFIMAQPMMRVALEKRFQSGNSSPAKV
jgi:hypothetical protein